MDVVKGADQALVFRVGKIREHPSGKIVVGVGLRSYAEAQAGKGVRAKAGDDILQTVVTACTAVTAKAESSGVARDIVG